MGEITHYTAAGPGEPGSVQTVTFRLFGQEFMGLNGGPIFPFTEAVSFVINCDTQDEVDYYWDTLSAGGETGQCGWLKDRWGLSWQVVPKVLNQLMSDADPETARRVTEVMLKMNKLVIADLENAAAGD